MPLYLMSHGEDEAKIERLIEANNIQVARNFVARDVIKGEKAAQKDLFRLAKAGVEIEVAAGGDALAEALAPDEAEAEQDKPEGPGAEGPEQPGESPPDIELPNAPKPKK